MGDYVVLEYIDIPGGPAASGPATTPNTPRLETFSTLFFGQFFRLFQNKCGVFFLSIFSDFFKINVGIFLPFFF